MHGTLQHLSRSICVAGLSAALRSVLPEARPVSAKTYRRGVNSAAVERPQCKEGCGKICRSPHTEPIVRGSSTPARSRCFASKIKHWR